MLLLNHELEGYFMPYSYTTTMMIFDCFPIFLHNYYHDFDFQFKFCCVLNDNFNLSFN